MSLIIHLDNIQISFNIQSSKLEAGVGHSTAHIAQPVNKIVTDLIVTLTPHSSQSPPHPITFLPLLIQPYICLKNIQKCASITLGNYKIRVYINYFTTHFKKNARMKFIRTHRLVSKQFQQFAQHLFPGICEFLFLGCYLNPTVKTDANAC